MGLFTDGVVGGRRVNDESQDGCTPAYNSP